jgi:hypothetical protein
MKALEIGIAKWTQYSLGPLLIKLHLVVFILKNFRQREISFPNVCSQLNRFGHHRMFSNRYAKSFHSRDIFHYA